MKQSKLLKELYAASLSHNEKRLEELKKIEFQKILARKAKGKPFTPKWTLAEI
jgi:hypothetical protein